LLLAGEEALMKVKVRGRELRSWLL